jgi:hypothetical protein
VAVHHAELSFVGAPADTAENHSCSRWESYSSPAGNNSLNLEVWMSAPAHEVYPARPIVDWPQWARTSLHSSATQASGQSPNLKLADIAYDPFVSQEKAEALGELLAHYQVPLLDGNSVFLEYKTEKYVSCNPPGSGQPYPCGADDWNSEIWNERAFTWKNGSMVEAWNFQSDWKPEPNTDFGGQNKDGLFGWEPCLPRKIYTLNNGDMFVVGK